jgi:hypothetical protein
MMIREPKVGLKEKIFSIKKLPNSSSLSFGEGLG